MAYINSPHTGWKIDATEGTETTLVAADFTGDWNASEIQLDRKIIDVTVAGTLGTAKTVLGSSKGTLAGFTMPISTLKEAGILQAAGFDAGTGTMNIGGQKYITTGANASRISVKSLSINQYNGYSLIKLLSAKPTSLSLTGKLDEVITLNADFAGIYSATSATGYTIPQIPATVSPIAFAGSTVTIDAVALKVSSLSLDFGIQYADVADGSLATGFGMGEITDIKPKITINPLAVAAATIDFYTKYNTGATVNFVWTFGSGTGNAYTVSATGVITSMKGNLDNDIQRKEIVIEVINSATNYGVKIVNA
jgi:hypothetical protein